MSKGIAALTLHYLNHYKEQKIKELTKRNRSIKPESRYGIL